MINLEDYIKCYDDVVDQETCKNIVNNINFNDFERARTSDDTEISGFRNCYQKVLSKEFDKKIYDFNKKLNQKILIKLISNVFKKGIINLIKIFIHI